MKRYTFEVKQHLNGETDFTVDILSSKWEEWYKEVMRRFRQLSKLETEEEKQEYMKDFPVFDITESSEFRILSTEHFEAIERFNQNGNWSIKVKEKYENM